MNNSNTFIKNMKIINKGFQNKSEINIENYLMKKRIKENMEEIDTEICQKKFRKS